LSIIVAVIMLLSLLPAQVAYGAAGEVGGSFTSGNVAPTITSVEVIPAAGGSAVTSMTPGTSYKAKIVAGDANTVDDIDQVRVAIVFDSSDSDPTADPGETGNTTILACLKWVKSGDTWSISPNSDTTWSLTSGNCTKPTDMSSSTGTWEFYFTIGKVATEGTGGSSQAGWDLFGEVKDEGTPAEAWDDRDLAMEWYGEIGTPSPASIDWSTVSLGTGFAEDTNEKGPISITYIANGNYDQKVKTTATWTGAPSGTATLDPSGTCSSANQFALKADDTATLPIDGLVTTGGVSIDDTGTQTGESGSTEANNTLWLKLASVFSNATYTGTITYTIENK